MMEIQARISIIMPAYNHARFIGQAIESIINQTDSDWELIVVDDGSTDDTPDVVATFRDPRIKYVKQANAGASMARNKGISLAQGKWITCVDSDDVMLPHNLQLLRATLEAHPEAGCAYGWFYFIDELGESIPLVHGCVYGAIPSQIDQPWPGKVLSPSGTSAEGQILPELLSTVDGTIVMGAFLARREWVERVSGFNPRRRQHQEHWDFFIRLARAGCTFACCRQVLLLLRDHSGGAHRDFEKMHIARLDVINEIYRDGETDASLHALIEPVRSKAYRMTYIDAAKAGFSTGRFAEAANYINLASHYAPLDHSDLDDMIGRSVKWLLESRCPDAVRQIQQGFALIHDAPLVEKATRQAVALYHLNAALRDYAEKHPKQALKHAFKAVAHEPRHVMNRGLVKVVLASLADVIR